MTKKELCITLSKLDVFPEPDIMAEQYPTDSDIAGEIIWFAYMNGDIEGRTVADLGAGTGILGIGCSLMGARKVYFVEKDLSAVRVLRKNLEAAGTTNSSIIVDEDMNGFDTKVDVVIQNPPFGTKKKHADTAFLDKAMDIANIVYSFHKAETKDYVNRYTANKGWNVTNYFEFDFPLKKSMKQHRKKVERIRVGCWRIERL